MALTISNGNGSLTGQANTQSPQASVGPTTNAAPAGNVQHGTANSLLTTQAGGISLGNQALSTVSLDSNPAGTGSSRLQSPSQPKHHPNALGLGVVAILVMLALVFFWITQRSAKNTTK